MNKIFPILILMFTQSAFAMDSLLAFDIFWTSCAIQKYCSSSDRTDSDGIYINNEEEARNALKTNKNLDQLTCKDLDQDLKDENSLILLKASIKASEELNQDTCLSKIKILEKAENN